MEDEDDNCVCSTAFLGVNSWSFVDRDIYGALAPASDDFVYFRAISLTDHI